MTQQNRMDKTREKIAKLIHLRYGFQDWETDVRGEKTRTLKLADPILALFEETGYKSPKEVEEKP